MLVIIQFINLFFRALALGGVNTPLVAILLSKTTKTHSIRVCIPKKICKKKKYIYIYIFNLVVVCEEKMMVRGKRDKNTFYYFIR